MVLIRGTTRRRFLAQLLRLAGGVGMLSTLLEGCTDSKDVESAPRVSKSVVVRPSSPSTDSTWDTFAADVQVRLERVDSVGNAVDASDPGFSFSVERKLQSNGSWKSVLTMQSTSEAMAPRPFGALFEPERFDIGRVEDDGLGGAPRVYNRRGDLLRAPSEEDLRSLFPKASVPQKMKNDIAGAQGANPPAAKRFDRKWVEQFVSSKDNSANRRIALERAMGRAVGQVAGKDRYLKRNGSTVIEVLADPTTALASEINEATDGTLTARTQLRYSDGPDGLLTLQSVRLERAERGSAKSRAITTITYSNVRLERRG